eukprot:SAG11_NODE_4739_length_1784_cov_3.214243_2_plen_34_part_00
MLARATGGAAAAAAQRNAKDENLLRAIYDNNTK